MDFLSQPIKDQIIDFANKTPTEEVCGLLVWSQGSGVKVEWVENVAVDRANDFEFDNERLKSIQRMNAGDTHTVIAIWHTHPLESQSAMLSPEDIANSKACRIPYLLYHPVFEQWDYFSPSEVHPYPLTAMEESPSSLNYYLGWRFEWNRCDCYTLVRSYYKGMLGIDILDYPRGGATPDCVGGDWNQLLDNFGHAGFRKVEADDPVQNGDIALLTLPGGGENPHHCLILNDVSTNLGLHLIDRNISTTILYGPSLINRTKLLVRHYSMK